MKTYRTTDLYISSFLKTIGKELVDAEKKNGRITFVFNDDAEDIKNLVIVYTDGKGQVEPRFFVDNIRNMKSLTHNL